MIKKPRIYLADLRHVAGGFLANTAMPLGIAFMKAVMDRDLPEVESRTFAYPDQLLEAMKSAPPDVLMLTNYVWNERLGRHFTNVAKHLQQHTLVVAGGPNIPVETNRRIEFFGDWNNLDVYALGEGDFLATEIVSRFLDAKKSITKFLKGGVCSSLYRLEGDIIHQPLQNKQLQLGKIPSPWLTGCQDHFFDGKLIPMIETNRGCPFKCTFCVQGVDFYSRIAHFEGDQVKEELTYIARRVKDVCPQIGFLNITGSNFGMYKRDVEISAHIGTLKEKYGWPVFVDCTTGKNAPDLTIKAIEQSNGTLKGITNAVQSMDDEVLQSIKRSNIKLNAYGKVMDYIRSKGIRTISQAILGLPNEALQTHLNGLRDLVDNGMDSVQNFQLMLVKGCEIESQDSRDEFEFKSKFRLSARCFGSYGGEAVLDVDEIVVENKSLSFDDYIHARQYHLAYATYWNQDWFDDLFCFAQNSGLKNSACMEAIYEAMVSDDGVVGKFMQQFIVETRAEIFSTPEECFKYYAEGDRFEKLLSGEIGDNLLYKYHAKASFLIWPEVCELAARAVKKLLITHGSDNQGPGFELFWEDFCRYLEYKHACGQSAVEILSPVKCQLQHDISQWIADGYPKVLSPYKLETKKTFIFELNENDANDLRYALETWSTELRGLTKMVRYLKVTSQVRGYTEVAEYEKAHEGLKV